MRYVAARLDEYEREQTYRIYVTRSLQLLPQGQFLSKNYEDLFIKDDDGEQIDGAALVVDFMQRAGLSFKGGTRE